MTKEEFIQKCAMLNMQATFHRYYNTDHFADDFYVNKAYEAAVKLANLIYKE